MPKKYSGEFKQEVIDHYGQGKSIKSISQELHLAQSTIYRWVKERCSIETPVRKYTPAEFDKLFRHAKKLEHELEIIHCTGLVTEILLQRSSSLRSSNGNRKRTGWNAALRRSIPTRHG